MGYMDPYRQPTVRGRLISTLRHANNWAHHQPTKPPQDKNVMHANASERCRLTSNDMCGTRKPPVRLRRKLLPVFAPCNTRDRSPTVTYRYYLFAMLMHG